MELTKRPRRLRGTDTIRRLCRETRLSTDSLIYPLFVDETLSGRRPIPSLPGQYHYGLDALPQAVEECLQAGVNSCLLFGLPKEKDPLGSSAWAENGVIQQAIRQIKQYDPDFYVVTDVCLCEYTDHGPAGPGGGQRPHPGAPRQNRPVPRPGRRRPGGPLGHDGRPGGGHPTDPGPSRL